MSREDLEATETHIFDVILEDVALEEGLPPLRTRHKKIAYADFDGAPKLVLAHNYAGVSSSEIKGLGIEIMGERHHVIDYTMCDEGGQLLSRGTLYCPV